MQIRSSGRDLGCGASARKSSAHPRHARITRDRARVLTAPGNFEERALPQDRPELELIELEPTRPNEPLARAERGHPSRVRAVRSSNAHATGAVVRAVLGFGVPAAFAHHAAPL